MIKIVYALASSSADYYLEQAYVSMYSLKRHMPYAHIVLATDSLTQASLNGLRKTELKYVDETIVVPLDGKYTQRQRSRMIKTSIRQYVSGDYLYIDTDTIICKPFKSLDNVKSDIAACLDTHCKNYLDNPYRSIGLIDGRKLNWPIDDETQYFNGGVIYVKDTTKAHEFYRLWNENLMDSFSKGINMDQASFAKTNYQMGHIIEVLDDVWNCELKHGIRYLKDALIVHYLTTNTSSSTGGQLFRLNEPDIFDSIKTDSQIPAEIDIIADDPFKGIASLTHTFAGNDVYFFQTQSYSAISKNGVPYRDCLLPGSDNAHSKNDFLQSDLFFYFMKNYPNSITDIMKRSLELTRRIKRAVRAVLRKK